MNAEPAIAEAASYFSTHKEKLTPTGGAEESRQILERMVMGLSANVKGAMTAEQAVEWAANLVRLGKESGDERAVRLVAADMIDRGDDLPSALRLYVVEVLRASAPVKAAKNRGPDKMALAMRDILIRQAVAWIARRHDLKPTRNVATEMAASGCSVISEALSRVGVHLSEGAVAKIWDGRKKN
jgi:hypothetical protein